MDMLSEIKFWQQVMTDAQRTVICSPEMESRCKGFVEARGLAGIITVKASPVVPNDRLIVLDEQALQAANHQAMTRPIRLWPDERHSDTR